MQVEHGVPGRIAAVHRAAYVGVAGVMGTLPRPGKVLKYNVPMTFFFPPLLSAIVLCSGCGFIFYSELYIEYISQPTGS